MDPSRFWEIEHGENHGVSSTKHFFNTAASQNGCGKNFTCYDDNCNFVMVTIPQQFWFAGAILTNLFFLMQQSNFLRECP